jgi:16S rRNA (guanine527-N7)-methyltransferase
VAAFGRLVADEGVVRGLIGPREVPILWERHLLNSAAVGPLLPAAATLVDVGSGAGFPGIVLAALRPDLAVTLLEPMERRVAWLDEVVAALALQNVQVVRGRAEEQHGLLRAEVVTARAVAPLDKLAGWTLPLLDRGGVLLALKGSQAAAELRASRASLSKLGGDAGEVLEVACPPGGPSTTVVRVVRTAPPVPPRVGVASTGRSGAGAGGSRRRGDAGGSPRPRRSRGGGAGPGLRGS